MPAISNRALAATAVAISVAAASPAARAQDDPAAEPLAPPARLVAAPQPDLVVYEELAPSSSLIGSGALMLGFAYGASLFVAAASDRDADQHLYIPVAGPWLDLAERGRCTTYVCGAGETANKILLVADGVIQGAGLVQIVAGFVFPERRTVTRAARPELRVGPTVGAGQVGIQVSGRF